LPGVVQKMGVLFFSMPDPCRNHAGMILNILPPFFLKRLNPSHRAYDRLLLIMPRSCRDGNPREKTKKLSGN
jgi:hypothetical protein